MVAKPARGRHLRKFKFGLDKNQHQWFSSPSTGKTSFTPGDSTAPRLSATCWTPHSAGARQLETGVGIHTPWSSFQVWHFSTRRMEEDVTYIFLKILSGQFSAEGGKGWTTSSNPSRNYRLSIHQESHRMFSEGVFSGVAIKHEMG